MDGPFYIGESMPNLVYSTITIVGDPAQLESIRKHLWSEKNEFDFEKIIPVPADVGRSWHEWRIKNWGTKWHAQEVQCRREKETELRYYFHTAWAPPWPVFHKLSNLFPDVELRIYGDHEENLSSTMLGLRAGEVLYRKVIQH
jgi:hypothetical protein